MSHLKFAEPESSRKMRFTVKSLMIYGFILHADKIFSGFAVNGQTILVPIEANSSSSHITASKGSSIWLHWNYTYAGDGTHGGVGALTSTYREQVIGFNSTSQSTIEVIAKRIGQNGVITKESSIPAPFTGRVEVISSNSTLVIHGLQYNDSTYQFWSNVKLYVNAGGGPVLNVIPLQPVISIAVNGIPDFKVKPPRTLDVNETSNLQLKIHMDGNPKPLAEFRWPHDPKTSTVSPPSVQLYPFVYSATYVLHNIDQSYCGRILQTTLINSIGSSVIHSTNITVLLKLDKDFGLQAKMIAASKCVEVKWNKTESGACYVKYAIKLKYTSGSQLYNKVGYNIREMRLCNLASLSKINEVELTVSFRTSSKVVTTRVSNTPIKPSASSSQTSNTALVFGASLALLSNSIVRIFYCLP